MVECKICKKQLTNERLLTIHLKKDHNIDRKNYTDQYLKLDNICPFCGKEKAFHNTNYDRTCGSKDCINKLKQHVYLERYGVINPGQRECQKEINRHTFDSKEAKQRRNEKTKKTCLQKYGTESSNQSKIVKDKIRQTMLIKYGVEAATQLEKCKKNGHTVDAEKRRKETLRINNLTKYGVENVYQSEAVKEKIKQTKLLRYGDENWCNPEKIAKTMLDNYGVRSYAQSEEAAKKHHTVTIYDGISFDSQLELKFYLFCLENNLDIEIKPIKIAYRVNDRNYFYFPDFIVNGVLCECKGKHLLEYNENNEIIGLRNPYVSKLTEEQIIKDKLKLSAKYACMLENNTLIFTDENEFNKILELK